MRLALAHTFAATPQEVYAALTDPVVLRMAIDGCEHLARTGENEYEARLTFGLGAITGHYKGSICMTSQRPPESLTLAIAGSGAGGFIRGTARIRLVARGETTDLVGDADGTVGGVIAAVGSRFIEEVARRRAADFFARLEAAISRGV